MRVLITGASGFVAPYLARELKSHGHTVVLTSRQPMRSSLFPVFTCGFTSVSAIRKILQRARPDAVVHLAGASHSRPGRAAARRMISANVSSTRKLCAALAGLKRPVVLLYVSSGFVYGSSRARLNEKSAVAPRNSYGESKRQAERAARSFASSRLRLYIVRPFNHTGRGQSAAFAVPAFAQRIARAKRRDSIPVGDLRTVRDFCDVRDIARAYRLILEKRPRQKLFVLGSGRPASMESIFRLLVRISGKKITPELHANLSTSKEVSSLVSNPALARRALGWRPRIPLNKTLSDIFNSFSR